MTVKLTETGSLKEKVLEENRRVHAREDRLYLDRHPEQTNFFQKRILGAAVERVASALQPGKSRVLDLGCGSGYLTLQFLLRGFRVTGVDLSPQMIHALEEKLPSSGHASPRLVVSDVEDFVDGDSEQYEAIVLSALLHHLYDYETVIKKICSRLASGGLLLIFFEPLKQKIGSPLRFTLHRWVAALDEAWYRWEMKARKIPLFEEEYELSDYQRRFGGIDPDRVIGLLQSENLEVLQVEKYCARRNGLSALIATRLLNTQNTFNLLARKRVE